MLEDFQDNAAVFAQQQTSFYDFFLTYENSCKTLNEPDPTSLFNEKRMQEVIPLSYISTKAF